MSSSGLEILESKEKKEKIEKEEKFSESLTMRELCDPSLPAEVGIAISAYMHFDQNKRLGNMHGALPSCFADAKSLLSGERDKKSENKHKVNQQSERDYKSEQQQIARQQVIQDKIVQQQQFAQLASDLISGVGQQKQEAHVKLRELMLANKVGVNDSLSKLADAIIGQDQQIAATSQHQEVINMSATGVMSSNITGTYSAANTSSNL